MNEALDTYQLAGLDDRERGFSRPVACERAGDSHRAVLRYETVRITTNPHPTPGTALLSLIQTLHARGYRQLKTQMSFRDGIYLGSQELWVEYPDPPQSACERPGMMAKLWSWLRPRAENEERP